MSDAKAVTEKTVYGDQLVDGGYFDNTGLTTATEIAERIKNEGLHPLILTIANHPEIETDTQLPPRPAVEPVVGVSEVAGRWHGFFARLVGLTRAPFEALYQSGNGHEAEARKRAYDIVNARSENGSAKDAFFKIKVYENTEPHASSPRCREPKAAKSFSMKQVSMSWWMSYPVQANLSDQLCDHRNLDTLDKLIERLQPPQ